MTQPRLLRLARRWFGRAAADRVFEPLIADWQHEAADAPPGQARAIAHTRGALAFATSGLLVVVRGAEPMTHHASRASRRVLLGVVFIGLLHGVYRGFNGASTAAVAAIAVSSALSVLPALTVGVTRQRRFARAWRLLLLVTALTLLAQAVLLTLAWPWILSVLETPTEAHWLWRLHLLVATGLPGVLGIMAARACSRRHAAPELFSLLHMFPIWAWNDLFSSYRASLPVMSAIAGVVFTVWAVNVARQEVARRAGSRARIAQARRLPSVPTRR